MAAKRQDREARVARERLRAYQARQDVHRHVTTRRHRDNVLAAVGVVVIVALAVLVQLVYFGIGPGKVVAGATEPTPSATPTPAGNQGAVPPASLADGSTWSGTLILNKDISLGIALDGAAAPQAVSSTVSLIQNGFYTGTVCHRLTDGDHFKVLQCGDPHGDDTSRAGTGGPGYSFGPVENAPTDGKYPAGTIAMARTSGDAYSMGSQFFIVWGDTTLPADAAGGYTVIGHVTSGLDKLVSEIADQGLTPVDGPHDGRPKVTTTITAATIKEDTK